MSKSPTPAYELPWSLEEFERDGETHGHIVCRDGTIVCEIRGILDACGNRQNAEFIVHAANTALSASIPVEIEKLVVRLTYHATINDDMGRVVVGQTDAMREAASALRALSAELETVKGERDELRLAIAGSDPSYFDPDSLSHGQYIEMAQTTERARAFAVERAEAAEAKLAGGEAVGWWIGQRAGEPAKATRMKRVAEIWADQGMSVIGPLTHPAPTHNDGSGEASSERRLIQWAHDTLYEINPSNYDHDEVCKLNDASVEVILGLAQYLGERHGKAAEWWAAYKAEHPLPALSHTSGEVTEAMVERGVERLGMYDLTDLDLAAAKDIVRHVLEAALRGDAS